MIQLNSHEALEALVMKLGFLPLFANEIPGFSVEEYTPQERWFSDENDGPWEWKGPIAGNGNCAYGKLFRGKAGFVSMDWFPELVNYRRSVYQLSAENDTERRDRIILNTVIAHESLLSKEIKSLCGYKKPRMKRLDPVESFESKLVKEIQAKSQQKGAGFETIMTRLQMGTWLVVADFEYLYDKHMQPYGWGIARYTTPELLLGESRVLSCKHSPEESKRRLVEYLSEQWPQASEQHILRIIG